MNRIDALFAALDESVIAREVTKKHDQAREEYSGYPPLNTYEEFVQEIGKYYKYHFTRCVAVGGVLDNREAEAEAENMIAQVFKENKLYAFQMAKDGFNGGMRQILDIIADSLKNRSSHNYSSRIISEYVPIANRPERIEICHQLAQRNKDLGPSFDYAHPENHVDNLEEIIRTIVENRTKHSSEIRFLSR